LPIGKEAVNRTAPYLPEVYEAIPFNGGEEALWALRIERGKGTLDLFGLAEYGLKGLSTGDVAFALRGRETWFVDLIRQAQRWWTKFRGHSVGAGRPLNSGVWGSRDEFVCAVQKVIKEDPKATQEKVSVALGCDDRQLRRWISHYDLTWSGLKRA
jgi:hypothetical protein